MLPFAPQHILTHIDARGLKSAQMGMGLKLSALSMGEKRLSACTVVVFVDERSELAARLDLEAAQVPLQH